MKTDSMREILFSRQEAARTGSLLANYLLQNKLDLTVPVRESSMWICWRATSVMPIHDVKLMKATRSRTILV